MTRWTELLTLIGCALCAVAASLTLIGEIATDDEPVPTSCVEVLGKYHIYVNADPRRTQVLTRRGSDGRAVWESDEAARQCGIDAETINEMAELNSPVPPEPLPTPTPSPSKT
jgi:hypothetical protein